MPCASDEPRHSVNAPSVRGRVHRWGAIAGALAALLLAADLPLHAASVYQSGGIIADDPPATTENSRTEPPPSSRQNKDAPLQAAPVISDAPDPPDPPADSPADSPADPSDNAPDNTPADPPETQNAAPPGTEPSGTAQRPAPRTTRAAPAPKASGLRLFGTVEFKGPLKNLASWLSVLDRNAKNSVFTPGKKLGTTAWNDLKGKLEKMQPMEQLQAVNRFWNQWPYRQDPEVYKKADYWAIPAEFIKNSGDCEDYAIAKYFTLKELGFDTSQMRIVVLMETVRNIAHAVLVVYMNGDAFVLDNLSNNVLSHSRYKNYLPQFSVNEQFRWAHVRPK